MMVSNGGDGMLEQALSVNPPPIDLDLQKLPTTGEEYLQHVIVEAANTKTVCFTTIDSDRFRHKATANMDPIAEPTQSPAHLLPSRDWQRHQVADFSAVRTRLARIKDKASKELKQKKLHDLPDDYSSWLAFCYGQTTPVAGIHTEGTQPNLKVLLSMHQSLIEGLLQCHGDWLREGRLRLCEQTTRWLYALLACLETPLAPDTCALLRDIARLCAKHRSQITLEDPMLAPLNLLICLVAHYFNQLDLADGQTT